MKIHSVEDFLDDKRFITEKQKAIYLKDGIFRGNYKNAIKRAFERYYTSFEWLRKKKGCPLQFELGDEREQYIENDTRASRQDTIIAKIIRQAIIEYINSLAEKDKNELACNRHVQNGYYCNTVFNFSFDLRLLDPALKKMKNNHTNMDAEKELEETYEENIDKFISDVYLKGNYLYTLENEWRKVFNQALKSAEFKGNIKRCNVLVFKKKFYNKEAEKMDSFYPQRIMTDDEQEKFNLFKKELGSRNDIEKPMLFHKETEKMELYKELQVEFLIENFGAIRTYEDVCIKIKKYSSDNTRADVQAFIDKFKKRTDKQHTKFLCSKIKNKIRDEMSRGNFINDTDETEFFYWLNDEFASAKNELEKFNKLDKQNKIISDTNEITDEIFASRYNEIVSDMRKKKKTIEDSLSLFEQALDEKKKLSRMNLKATYRNFLHGLNYS